MHIRLTNSLTRRKETFTPATPERVTMYVCGPTVYARAHIGNFRPLIVFDVLARLLRSVYGKDSVIHAYNITDIDDKIIAVAKERGTKPAEVAAEYETAYLDDAKRLAAAPPDVRPRATEFIPEIISLIGVLEAKGAAYARPSGVLMRVAAAPEYGQLSGRDARAMRAGARVDPSADKEDAQDFYLWKAAQPDDPPGSVWESPWGRGRPGWHIECSAMAAGVLGEQIDIHGGGIDLMFPHHENEMAQSRCAHGRPMARYWLHNGHVHFADEKMSKSTGNTFGLDDIQARLGAGPETVRLCLLSARYRSPLNWTDALVRDCQRRLDRLYMAVDKLRDLTPAAATDTGVAKALADDLNTPVALAHLSRLAEAVHDAGDPHALARSGSDLLAAGALLGLFGERGQPDTSDRGIAERIAERDAARANRDWAESDRIRDTLAAEGIEVMDAASGTRWRRVGR